MVALSGLAAAAASSVENGSLKDYSNVAVTFFTSVRVPSSIILGTSLQSLFAMVKKDSQKDEKNLKNSLRVVSMFLYFLALLLVFNVTVHATTSLTNLLIGNHNGMANSAWEFMMREFEYEFLVTRWSFLMGLMCFILALAGRMVLAFDLLDQKPNVLALVLLSMLTIVSHTISYMNSTLVSSSNLFTMTIKVFKLEMQRGLNTKRPNELLSVLGLIASSVLLVKAVISFLLQPITKIEAEPLKKRGISARGGVQNIYPYS